MSVFKKRETLIENITYMAIMAAVNVVFVLLTFFIPFLLFLLVFILPLSSAIVCVYCKKRYYIIYAVATLAICMLVTIGNFSDTLFFVFPSLITGFIFGFLIEKKIPSILVIGFTTLIQILLTYPGLWLATEILYPSSEDIFKVIATTIGFGDHPYLPYIKHTSIAFIALVQEAIAFIVIKEEANKIGFEIDDNAFLDKLIPTISIFAFSALSFIFIGVYSELCYVFMLGSTLFAIYEIAKLITERKVWINISLLCSLLLGILFFAGLYTSVKEPLGFTFLQIFYCFVGIIVLINNYLLTYIKKR